MKKTKKYKFEFFFYKKYAFNYKSYFENKSRLSIWNEKYPKHTFTGEFIDCEEKNNQIIGFMNLLINCDEEILYDTKYLMNHPEDLVGHIMRIDLKQ